MAIAILLGSGVAFLWDKFGGVVPAFLYWSHYRSYRAAALVEQGATLDIFANNKTSDEELRILKTYRTHVVQKAHFDLSSCTLSITQRVKTTMEIKLWDSNNPTTSPFLDYESRKSIPLGQIKRLEDGPGLKIAGVVSPLDQTAVTPDTRYVYLINRDADSIEERISGTRASEHWEKDTPLIGRKYITDFYIVSHAPTEFIAGLLYLDRRCGNTKQAELTGGPEN